MTTNTEAETTHETAAPRQKPRKRAAAGARKPRVGAGKPESIKKASNGRKRDKSQNSPASTAREGSKTAKVLDLLKRPKGTSLNELMKATGWQAHSVRGFLSGTVRKKLCLTIVSLKGESGERSYSVKA